MPDLHGSKEERGSGEHEGQYSQHYAQHFVVSDIGAERVVCHTFNRIGRCGGSSAAAFLPNRVRRGDSAALAVPYYHLEYPCSTQCERVLLPRLQCYHGNSVTMVTACTVERELENGRVTQGDMMITYSVRHDLVAQYRAADCSANGIINGLL